MTALGLGLAWGGYLVFVYGYTMIRGYSMSLSDLALPTHRTAALASIKQGATNDNAAASNSAASSGATPGAPVSPGAPYTGTAPYRAAQPPGSKAHPGR